MKYLLAVAIAASIIVGGFWEKALALTVSPNKIELTGLPGETIRGQFIVVNEQADTKILYTSVENFEAQGESGTPTFVAGTDGLASWIQVEPQLTLSTGEQRTIPFTVTVPPSAEAGGYFSAIFLASTPPQNTGGGQVSIGSKIGVLVLFSVPGDVKEEGGILSFTAVNNKKVFTARPVSFLYRYRNDGADRVLLGGDVTIKNMFGRKVEALKANPTEGSILPGSTRKFQVDWGTGTSTPKNFFGAVKHELTHFGLGPYTAHLALAYGNGKTVVSDFHFFLIPWQLLIIVLIILIILFWLIRAYNRWIIKKANRSS